MPDWLQSALAEPTMSVPLAGQAFGLSRNASYEAARRGEIPTMRFGKRLRVPTRWVRRKLELDEAGGGVTELTKVKGAALA